MLNNARGITTFQTGGHTYAAIASLDDNGVQILDVTDPDNIRAAGHVTDGADYPELFGAHAITPFQAGGHTYAAVASFRDDGVQILNVTDPPNITAADHVTQDTDYPELDGAIAITHLPDRRAHLRGSRVTTRQRRPDTQRHRPGTTSAQPATSPTAPTIPSLAARMPSPPSRQAGTPTRQSRQILTAASRYSTSPTRPTSPLQATSPTVPTIPCLAARVASPPSRQACTPTRQSQHTMTTASR